MSEGLKQFLRELMAVVAVLGVLLLVIWALGEQK